MLAIAGRASFLGERSIGHMDPGSRSASRLIGVGRCDMEWEGIHEQFDAGNVGIVIVSHSPKIAEGAADMVRQMVGNSVPLAWTGGDAGGGLGTNVAGILEAIEAAWSPAGVAILVDLGGAETNSEMAVEMLPEDRRSSVVVCNAPVVEGAVIAATEASGRLAACGRQAQSRRNSMPQCNASLAAEHRAADGRGGSRQRSRSACAAFGQAHAMREDFCLPRWNLASRRRGPGPMPKAR